MVTERAFERSTGQAVSRTAYSRVCPSECQPAIEALVSIRLNPVPAGLVSGVFRARDGLGLRYALSVPHGSCRGTVVLLLGRADFIEKYFETIADLQGRGFAVATLDWRGQGGSERLHPDATRNHGDSFGDHALDLEDFVVGIVRRHMPAPYIGFAHSMGAAVLLHALARKPALFDRAVLTAPMIEISPSLKPPGAAMMARICAMAGLGTRVIPGSPAKEQAVVSFPVDNVLSSDPERFLRSYHILAAGPHLGVGRPTIGWLDAAFQAMAAFRSDSVLQHISLPVLTVAGSSDRVTETRAAISMTERLAHGQAIVLDRCRHDVLMERDSVRDRFWAAFDGFVGG